MAAIMAAYLNYTTSKHDIIITQASSTRVGGICGGTITS